MLWRGSLAPNDNHVPILTAMRTKIHVVNGHSISLGHAEVKSLNRVAKNSLGGLAAGAVKRLSATRHLTT
jgi:hypothetical protein